MKYVLQGKTRSLGIMAVCEKDGGTFGVACYQERVCIFCLGHGFVKSSFAPFEDQTSKFSGVHRFEVLGLCYGSYLTDTIIEACLIVLCYHLGQAEGYSTWSHDDWYPTISYWTHLYLFLPSQGKSEKHSVPCPQPTNTMLYQSTRRRFVCSAYGPSRLQLRNKNPRS